MKEKIIEKFKAIIEFIKENKKVIGGTIVMVALVIACIVSTIDRQKKNNPTQGTIMALADVAVDSKVFEGHTFGIGGTTYDEMLYFSYNTAPEVSSNSSSYKDEQQMLIAALEEENSGSGTLKEQVTEAPTTQAQTIIVSANNLTTTPTMVDDTGEYVYQGDFILTAYCPCPICCGAYSNMENPITASGTRATAGRTIAADTSLYPFGTQLAIDGIVYTVEDRGGAIKGQHIDVFFATHSEAIAFGKRTGAVYLKVK